MDSSEWLPIAKSAEVVEGRPVLVKVDGEEILLARVDGQIHAISNRCSHYDGPLHQGLSSGREVTCPWHQARFDLTSGLALQAPARKDLNRYPVRIVGDTVQIGPAIRPVATTFRPTSTELFALVGAGAAGNAAAETLRREGFTGKIALISAEPDLPYDRPTLSKGFLSGEAKPEWIPLHGERFYADLAIDLWLGRRVTRVEPNARILHFEDGDTLRFDQALLATGGTPRRLLIPGAGLPGVNILRSFGDAQKLLEQAERAEVAVVLGAGFIGMEVAASLSDRGISVQVVDPGRAPMIQQFGDRIGRWIQSFHEANGVRFHLGSSAAQIRGKEQVREVVLCDGTVLPADLVVVGIGSTPVVDFLANSGLVENGVVPVDGRMQTVLAGLYAAGDIALIPDARPGEVRRVEHWVEAERQGQHAARAMLGSRAPYREVPFFWTRQFERSIQFVGSAQTSDRLAVRGTVEDGEFVVGFFKDGILRAAVGADRPREMIALAAMLKAGRTPTTTELEDPAIDLAGMYQQQVARDPSVLETGKDWFKENTDADWKP